MHITEDYLARLKESETVELKESAEKIPLSFYESYCAMANGQGGTIYLGIVEGEPQNTICGVENAPQKVKQLCNALTMRDKIANNIFYSNDVSIVKTSHGDVIKVDVRPVPMEQRPVYLNNDPALSYKRVGEGDKKLDEDEVRGMINDSSKTKFDQKANLLGLGFDDLDPTAVEHFIERAKAARRIASVETMSPLQIMRRIGAIVIDPESKKEVLTNGAVLFFGTSVGIHSTCGSLWMEYREMTAESERYAHRITNKDLNYEPNIFSFFERVENRLGDVLPTPFHLNETGTNDGKSLVTEIIREALANAISNVDLGSSLGVVIKKEGPFLSLRNAGGLLTGMEQARAGGVSKPRNPCIFNFFLAIGITDHGGYGVPTIFERMKSLHMPEPTLQESGNRDETTLSLMFSQNSNHLSAEEKEVMALLYRNPTGLSSSEVAGELNVSAEKARQILLGLIEKGEARDNGMARKGRLYFASNKEN